MDAWRGSISARTARRRSGRRGSAMVEASLCLLLFMASAVGIIDVSLGIFVRETMQHAVREGTRFAITYQKVDGLCQIPSIKKIVKLHSMDFLTDAQVDAHVKVKFYLPDGSAESGENKPGHLVEVSVENYEWKWIAPIWRSNESLKITVRSSDKMEGLPGSGGAPCMGS